MGGAHLQSAGRGPTNFEISWRYVPRTFTCAMRACRGDGVGSVASRLDAIDAGSKGEGHRVFTALVTFTLSHFSFCAWAPSFEALVGRSKTFMPVASASQFATGILPPSRVRSGGLPKTLVTALLAATCVQINQ